MIVLIGAASHTGKTAMAQCMKHGTDYILIDQVYEVDVEL